MSIPVEQITEAVLSLPSDARALLADRLVESLDPIHDDVIRKAWSIEAKNRLQEITSGEIESIPGDIALQKVRQSLRK